MSLTENLMESLPSSAKIEEFAIVPLNDTLGSDLFLFPKALHKKAVVLNQIKQQSEHLHFQILTVPAICLDDEEHLKHLNEWIKTTSSPHHPPLVLSLQNVQVFWTPRRIVIFVDETNTQNVKAAVIEVSYYISELVSIEEKLAESWPDLEADIPVAFQYDQYADREKKQLLTRFQETYSLRAQLSKLTPFLLSPHTYPPTLASQISDRLRERVRVEDRVEFVSDSLEVHEEIYELCGQRANDYLHARKGHTLEWIIIILLAAELIVVGFDYLSSLGS